jgi:hypothetical protein
VSRLLLIADHRPSASGSREAPVRRYRIARLPAGARLGRRSTGSAIDQRAG